MGPVLTTVLLAFGVVLIALALLGIGWLLTGKNKIIRGACGMDPEKLRNEKCGTDKISCELCKPDNKKKEKKETNT